MTQKEYGPTEGNLPLNRLFRPFAHQRKISDRFLGLAAHEGVKETVKYRPTQEGVLRRQQSRRDSEGAKPFVCPFLHSRAKLMTGAWFGSLWAQPRR